MKNNKNGFTLIELVITMLIMVIVFGVLSNFIGFSTRFYSDERSQVASQEALRIVAVSFEKDVRKLVEREDYITVTESAGVRIFTLGESSSTSKIIYNYNIAEKKVYRVTNTNSTLIASGIGDMTVTKDITGNPFIDFSIDSVADGRDTINKVDVRIFLRVLSEDSLGG